MKFFGICLGLLMSANLIAQPIEVIKYPDLAKLIESDKDKVAVFNFWATWCRPCIKEIPYFEQAQQDYASKGVQVYLVSFDFVEELDTKVKNFVDKKGLKSSIKLLDETDYNAFIDKIDPSWSGAIPATLIVDNINNEKHFFEKEFEEGELETIINDILN